MEKIDITPKWVEILPILFEILENGNEEAKQIARAEIQRLAKTVDNMNSEIARDVSLLQKKGN